MIRPILLLLFNCMCIVCICIVYMTIYVHLGVFVCAPVCSCVDTRERCGFLAQFFSNLIPELSGSLWNYSSVFWWGWLASKFQNPSVFAWPFAPIMRLGNSMVLRIQTCSISHVCAVRTIHWTISPPLLFQLKNCLELGKNY